MRAEIKRDGYLWVYAETELEGYALQHWSDENPIRSRVNSSGSEPFTKMRTDMSLRKEEDDILATHN